MRAAHVPLQVKLVDPAVRGGIIQNHPGFRLLGVIIFSAHFLNEGGALHILQFIEICIFYRIIFLPFVRNAQGLARDGAARRLGVPVLHVRSGIYIYSGVVSIFASGKNG